MKTEKRPVEITVAGELPGFEYGTAPVKTDNRQNPPDVGK